MDGGDQLYVWVVEREMDGRISPIYLGEWGRNGWAEGVMDGGVHLYIWIEME